MDNGDISISGDEDMEIRLQSTRRFDFDLEEEYHSPEISHEDLARSSVPVEDKDKNDGLAVPIVDTTKKSGQLASNVLIEDATKKDWLMESDVPIKDKAKKDGVPEIGMEFESEEEAYDFYNRYAGKLGFSVRKDWLNKSKNGIVQSRRYCCYKEGFRKKDPRDRSVKTPSKETRTGCLAHMIIALQPNGKYHVIQFEAIHNHAFVSPDRAHLLKSQRKVTPVQVAKADEVDNSGIPPMGQDGGHEDVNYPPVDYKNYLRSKRMKAMKRGDAGGVLQYFQRMQLENPLFFYAIQLDIYDQMTNIFWADTKMVVDYDHFGDVVCLDTSYKTNNFDRPFALFIGVNHHKKLVIFGAALLYDETTESFKWLFETFIKAMSGKMPKTILTDQDAAMANAIALVFPETYHRICVWQIYQSALNHHLSTVFGGSKSFDKDFSNCIFDNEDEEDFIQAWESMLYKYNLRENAWLQKLFKEKEKWALAYGRLAFCADMKGTQLSDGMNSILRNYLNCEQDLVQFFQHFERLVEERRAGELKSSSEMNHITSKLLIPVKILKQAADFYTPAIFEMFKTEYGRCLDYVVYLFSEVGTVTEYKISEDGKPHEHTVTFNSSDDTIVCSCRKFEFAGILCSHSLKVLDHRNVKVIPPRYILKRWTKDAKFGTVGDSRGCTIQVNPDFDLVRRFARIAARAAETEEAYAFTAFYSDKLLQEVEGILKRTYSYNLNPYESDHAESLHFESVDSSSEHVEIILNEIRGRKDSNGVNVAGCTKSSKVKGVKRRGGGGHGGCRMNSTEGGTRSKPPPSLNLPPPSPSAIPYDPNSPPAYYPIQASSPALFTQGSYGFEENSLGFTSLSHAQSGHHMVHCLYQPSIPFMHQQPNPSMNQPSNPSTNQHGFPGFIHLSQESLAPSLYQESASSSSQFS